MEEELAGRQTPTRVGQAIEALGIHPIFALSPQAKGRIERLFKTFQDRLVAELDLAKATTPEAGNEFLPVFLRKFNRRFSVAPAQAEKAWRNVPEALDVDRAISFHYPTKVGLDNTVRVGKLIIDIRPGPQGRSYAKARVEVRQLLDGSWRVYYKNALIARHSSTAIREPIRALPRNRSGGPGPKSPHWIYRASAPPIYDDPFR